MDLLCSSIRVFSMQGLRTSSSPMSIGFLVCRINTHYNACQLVDYNGGFGVLEDSSTKEIYIDTQAGLVLPSLPSGLIVKPALVWKIAQ